MFPVSINCLGIGQNGNLWAQILNDSNYYKYSPTGNLLATYPSKPSELGEWKFSCKSGNSTEKRCTNLQYQIEYPDAVYVYDVTKAQFKSNLDKQLRIFPNLIMDNKGKNVYSYSVTATVTPQGWTRPQKWLGFSAVWGKPEDDDIFHPNPEDKTIGGTVEIIAQYGDPVIGPDGSIYCWMRSETQYKILKWTWTP
jgi:hypothetical protein